MLDVIFPIITLVLFVAGSYCAYKAGVHSERANHYRWMSEGWRLLADHIDFLMIARPDHDQALEQHLIYVLDVFSMNRPYPTQKEKEKEGTAS